MKVTLINKADAGGGAAAAGTRLFMALREAGTDVKLLVQQRSINDDRIAAVVNSPLEGAMAEFNFLAERLPFILKEKDPSVRFAFSTAATGRSIAHHPDVAGADILHLHWTNGGFLSDKNLLELFKLNKPMVLTLHDMWAFSGGCHYTAGCRHFEVACGNCPFLKHPHPGDLSHRGWMKKQVIYRANPRITFVACSNWMKEVASQSALLKGKRITAVPNPIDTALFIPRNKTAARQAFRLPPDEKVILFGAANINDKRKGIGYLKAALEQLRSLYPELASTRIVLFGKNKVFETGSLPFPVTAFPLIRSDRQLAELYSTADVFVLPSLEDNLPNMVMEALSCGTPVVAFDTGGLPDLIDHRSNGYLAEYQSAADLAKGIYWALTREEPLAGERAREKVTAAFAFPVVARAYQDIYRELLDGKGK